MTRVFPLLSAAAVVALGCSRTVCTLPDAEYDRGGVTFDFDAISERDFGVGSGATNLLGEGVWSPYCHIHTYDLKDDDPMRTAVRKGIVWSTENGICRVEKKRELLACCNGLTNFVKCTDGSFKRIVRLPDAAGGTYRLKLRYSLRQPDEGLKGRPVILSTPIRHKTEEGREVEAERGRIRSLWVNALPGEWPLFCKTVYVPEGMDALELWVRLDGVGEFAFKDVALEKLPEKDFEIRVLVHELLDGTFALGRGQPGCLGIEWRRSPKLKFDSSKVNFRLELPAGVRYLGSNFSDRKTERSETRADGGTVVRFRLRKGRGVSPGFNAHRMFGLVLETDRANGPIGEGRLAVELQGRELGCTKSIRFLAVDPVRAGAVPESYANGISVGAGIDGLYFDYEDDALVGRCTRAFADAGCMWVLDHPLPAARDALRKAGVRKLLCETGRVSNGYHIGNMETAPADERFVPWRDKGGGGFGRTYVTNSACPTSVYREKPFFRTASVKWIGDFLKGYDGMWGNWEPSMFGGGCVCESCRDEFARYADLPAAELAKVWPKGIYEPGSRYAKKHTEFLSWQHGQVIRTLDRLVRSKTGGKDSLGFMPGMGWLEVSSWWRPHNHAAEWLVKDYADDLEWIEPWGPYDAWERDSPWVYEKRKPLAVFRAAKDMRRTVDADYPSGRRPKLASFPHGVQGDNWLTQPERLSMALDGFFFNRWEASIVYFFPRGCDARYWRGFAEATVRAARYEPFVRDGRTADADVTTIPVAGTYAANSRRPTAFLPHDEDVPVLQTAAFEKDGVRIVAAFNFWEKGEAFFDLRLSGLASGRYAVISEDGVLWAPDRKRVYWTAEELSGGIRLVVGAVRTKVFEIHPQDGAAAPDDARSVMTRSALEGILKSREQKLREAASEDRMVEDAAPMPTEAWSPLI